MAQDTKEAQSYQNTQQPTALPLALQNTTHHLDRYLGSGPSGLRRAVSLIPTLLQSEQLSP